MPLHSFSTNPTLTWNRSTSSLLHASPASTEQTRRPRTKATGYSTAYNTLLADFPPHFFCASPASIQQTRRFSTFPTAMATALKATVSIDILMQASPASTEQTRRPRTKATGYSTAYNTLLADFRPLTFCASALL